MCFPVSVAEKDFTVKNTVIAPHFLVWKCFGKAQFPHSFRQIVQDSGNCAFPRNFHTSKLGGITIFFVVFNVLNFLF